MRSLKSCGVLLAAGRGTRFGSDKLLHPLPNGVPMVVQSAKNLLAVLDEVWAVVPPQHDELHRVLAQIGCKNLINHAALTGMGSSVALAARHWKSLPEFDGVLIALGDMPFIQTETLHLLVDTLGQGASLCAPEFNSQRGQPVGFSKDWQTQLMSLTGDVGARDLIRAHSAEMTLIPVNDPGIHLDIDTPDHLVLSKN